MSSEELWQHALRFLQDYAREHDTIDRDTFFRLAASNEFSDILDHHGSRFKSVFSKGEVNLMVIYTELVQMMLEREETLCKSGFHEAFNVHKIEGFQYLNTRSQTKLNTEVRHDLRLLAKASAAHDAKIDVILERLEKQEKKNERQTAVIAHLQHENKQLKELMAAFKGVPDGLDDRLNKIEHSVVEVRKDTKEVKKDVDKLEDVHKVRKFLEIPTRVYANFLCRNSPLRRKTN